MLQLLEEILLQEAGWIHQWPIRLSKVIAFFSPQGNDGGEVREICGLPHSFFYHILLLWVGTFSSSILFYCCNQRPLLQAQSTCLNCTSLFLELIHLSSSQPPSNARRMQRICLWMYMIPLPSLCTSKHRVVHLLPLDHSNPRLSRGFGSLK